MVSSSLPGYRRTHPFVVAANRHPDVLAAKWRPRSDWFAPPHMRCPRPWGSMRGRPGIAQLFRNVGSRKYLSNNIRHFGNAPHYTFSSPDISGKDPFADGHTVAGTI